LKKTLADGVWGDCLLVLTGAAKKKYRGVKGFGVRKKAYKNCLERGLFWPSICGFWRGRNNKAFRVWVFWDGLTDLKKVSKKSPIAPGYFERLFVAFGDLNHKTPHGLWVYGAS
jgi:hypothetical protein